jgi:hypothetical protein
LAWISGGQTSSNDDCAASVGRHRTAAVGPANAIGSADSYNGQDGSRWCGSPAGARHGVPPARSDASALSGGAHDATPTSEQAACTAAAGVPGSVATCAPGSASGPGRP